MTPLLKNLLIGLGLALIALVGAYLYANRDISDSLLTNNAEISNQAALEAQDFLRRLNELRVIKLDDALFEDERFRSLIDFRQDVVPEPVGRDNPYLRTGSQNTGSQQ